MERKLHILSWLLVVALLLPLFQQVTDIPHKRKLKGAISIAEVPEFSIKGWFNGIYQPKAQKALNDRFGFRRLFVKVNNQVAYSLYDKIYAGGVVIGKENYYYETNYINGSYGNDYCGDSILRNKAMMLKLIQDSLASRGTQLLVTLAAGKGSFYPEFIPEKYHTEKKKTNGEMMVELFEEEGINYIDFNSWFKQMKDTSSYCLYPRTGIHWSMYGMVLAADSLIRHAEMLTGKDIAPFEWGDIKLSKKYKSPDKDIEEGLNILFRVNRDELAYPRITYPEAAHDSVKAIIIGDSFYWGMHNFGISNRAFYEGEFWFYYERAYAAHFEKDFVVDEFDKLQKYEEADIIILMSTEATHVLFPWGFADEAYTLLTE
jgi:hypothetical protein